MAFHQAATVSRMSDQTLTPAGRIRIGHWRLDASTHRLHGAGQEKRLTRLQVQLLLALAERPHRSWSRQELIERVWPRRMVADEVLSRAIAQLRLLLEDDARNPNYIETLHGTGYRLLAEVGLEPATPAAPSSAPPTPASVEPSPAGRFDRRPWRVLAPTLLTAGVLLAAIVWPDTPPPNDSHAWSQRIAAAQSYMSTGDPLQQPRFSADGRLLLWIDPTHGRLQVGDRRGSVLHRIDLAPEHVGSAVFARDGQSVYALLQHEGCRLVEIPLPSRAAPVELSRCLHASLGLAIEDDGSLLFTGPDQGVQRHRRDGSPEQVLTTPDCTGCIDSQPRAAGESIAFLRGRAGRHTLWLRQPSGDTKPLSSGDDRITDLAFDREHKTLLAASNAYGSPALVEIAPVTARAQLLGARGAYGLDVATDGALVFEQRRVQSPLWLQTADGTVRALTQSLRDDSQPALSPDARNVAFVSNRSGSGSVWLLDLANESETALSLPPARAWTRPGWSPDGQRLWLSRYDDTGMQAVQVDVATARLLPLPHALLGQRPERVVELAQSEWLLVVQRDETRVLIHQRDTVGIEMPGSEGLRSLAHDADWVVFERADDPRLWAWRWNQPGQPPYALSPRPLAPWTVYRGELWQYSPDRDGSILRTDLAGHRVHLWATGFGPTPRDLQVLDDGSTLLFSRVQRVDSELMLSVPGG